MEVLRGRGGVAHLDVVVGAEGEEALDARRAVLGALALEAVRQQQHQAVRLAPLVLRRHDVLVDDDLCTVDEVAELGFPHHECLLVLVGVAVLETERRVFAEQAVVHPEAGLPAGQGCNRYPRLLVLVVDERGVALAEGAAAAVLAGEANRSAFGHQRTHRQQLGRGPIRLALLVVGRRTASELTRQLRVRCEPLRVGRQVIEDRIERGPRHPGLHVRPHAHRLGRLGGLHRVRCMRAGLVERRLQLVMEVGEGALGFLHRQLTTLHQGLDVQLANTAPFGDGLVHQRLGVAGIVTLVVPEAAVAHHVDDDVLVEALSVFERQLGHAHTGLRVVAVDVEDRCLHGLGNVAAVQRAA